MRPRILGICGCLLPLALAAGELEVIEIPVGRQGGEMRAVERPQRGLSQARVLARHGEPQSRGAAVGDPPISRWQYPGFTVYFEGDTVIHSVVTHAPRHPLD